jgi:iron complex transport system ATP-binding protein
VENCANNICHSNSTPHKSGVPRLCPLLKLRALSLRLGRRLVLDNVHLEAEAGQLWVFLGPNGSGKTTLLKTTLGFLTPSSGQVLLHEKPLGSYGHKARARHMAWVPQHLPEESAFSGLELASMGRMPFCKGLGGPGPRECQMAQDTLEEMGLAELAHRPLGQLSGGERRMLWLARAFVQAPQVLCLDEPTAFLDMSKQSLTLELLRQRCRREGLLALVVLHELNLALAYATHALLLKEGRVLAAGPAAEHLTADTLSALFDMPLAEARCQSGQTLMAPKPPSGPCLL